MVAQLARRLTDTEILAELQRVARAAGREAITIDDLRVHGARISVEAVRSRFGSWAKGLQAAERLAATSSDSARGAEPSSPSSTG